MTDRDAVLDPPREPGSLKRNLQRESPRASKASSPVSTSAAQMPPNVRAFLDALAELLLDHVLAKRQNPASPDPSAQPDVRTARSNPPRDRSGGSL